MKRNLVVLFLAVSLAAAFGQEVQVVPQAPQIDTPEGAAPAAPAATPVQQNFTLGWGDPNAQGKVAGYKVKYGTSSGSYPTVVDVPGQAPPPPGIKTKAFTNFPLGTYYFVVTAYNAQQVQSLPSSPELICTVTAPTPTPTPTPSPTPTPTATPTPTPPTPTPTPTPTPAPPIDFGVVAGLAQMNTRGKVGSGNEQMIASFSTTKDKAKLLIRALGPSLPSSLKPVKGTTVELRDTNGVFIEGNNGWQNGPDKQELIDSGLAPPDAAESALIATVDPGTYNVMVGYTSRTGIGQLEVYQIQ